LIRITTSWFDCLYSTRNLQKHQAFRSSTIEAWNLISIILFLLPAWFSLVYEAFMNIFRFKYGQRQGHTDQNVQA
jgi:TRAP-type mannitol/chloroaromatic compound transport system permease small subunit